MSSPLAPLRDVAHVRLAQSGSFTEENEVSRFHRVLRFAVELTLILATAAAFGLFIFLSESTRPL